MGGSISFPCDTNNPTPAVPMHHSTLFPVSLHTLSNLLFASDLPTGRRDTFTRDKHSLPKMLEWMSSMERTHNHEVMLQFPDLWWLLVYLKLICVSQSCHIQVSYYLIISKRGLWLQWARDSFFVACWCNGSVCSCSDCFEMAAWWCLTPEELP